MGNGNRKTKAFSTVRVEFVRITLNNVVRTWRLQPAWYGLFTLKELVNWSALKVDANGNANPTPRKGAPLATAANGFVGTETNVWNINRDGHETYNCDPLGFNYDSYADGDDHAHIVQAGETGREFLICYDLNRCQ